MIGVFSIIFGIFIVCASSQVTKIVADNYDYCDPALKLCDVADDHVMCKYPVSALSDKCTPSLYEPLNATEKNRILLWHNKFRSNIAVKNERSINKKLPASSNMRQLYWDRELELLAERWAQQCLSSSTPKVYDKCRNIRRFQVSQNIGTRRVNGTIRDKQTPQIVIAWFKESKDFLPAYVDEFPLIANDKVAVKQFANVIWANTYAIGCARAIFQENLTSVDKNIKKSITWTVERLICNYGPGGNIVGKPVYKRGVSCENCPEGTTCSKAFPGLCATQSVETAESQQNVENQEKKEFSEETTPQVSVEDSLKSKKAEEDDDQVRSIFQLNDGEEDEKEETTEVHYTRISDLTRVNEILKNPKIPTEVERLGYANPDRIFIDFAGRRSIDQCVVILVHRKSGLTDESHFETYKWRERNEKKKSRRDVVTWKPTQNGERCLCYIPIEGKLNSAPCLIADFFLFCIAMFSGLLLLY